jgi:hypothetical protein
MKDEFEPFGIEWRKTLMKHSLASLVELFKPEPNTYKTKDELISQIRLNLIVKQFNEKHPVGSVVYWKTNVGATAQPMTLQSNAFKHNASAVCYFKERSGFCCIEPNFLEG